MSAPSKSDGKQSATIRVLRIGVVQNGKIIDERELKKRESVTIGNNPKATFQVASEALPRGVFELFEVAGGKYYLRYTQAMEGRIQISGTSVATFADLEKQGRVSTRGDAKGVELTDESRGKVVVGDV